MAKQVYNTEQFLNELSKLDGEAKWYMNKGNVFITDSMTESSTFPRDVITWGYAFSDELDCIDWKKMGFENPY
jgi:hypothetical protein